MEMGDHSSSSYIHMVQHLIEQCLIFGMSKEECMKALSKHANIKPVITSTVWSELEKENKEFFDSYLSQPQYPKKPDEKSASGHIQDTEFDCKSKDMEKGGLA